MQFRLSTAACKQEDKSSKEHNIVEILSFSESEQSPEHSAVRLTAPPAWCRLPQTERPSAFQRSATRNVSWSASETYSRSACSYTHTHTHTLSVIQIMMIVTHRWRHVFLVILFLKLWSKPFSLVCLRLVRIIIIRIIRINFSFFFFKIEKHFVRTQLFFTVKQS